MFLSPSEKLILASTKLVVHKNELEQINSLIPLVQDWGLFANTIIERGTGPLLFKKLTLINHSGIIPESVKDKLQQSYFKTLGRSMVLHNAFANVGIELNNNNIPFIALKGIYLSEWLYKDIGLRQFSDIDLLVKEEDGERCLELLSTKGYKPRTSSPVSDFVASKSDFVHYAPMELNDISIEIHVKLHKNKEKYKLAMDSIWKNALPVTIDKVAANTLDLSDMMIYLCIHLDKHFREGHVQFTSFNDITNLLEMEVTGIEWDKFINRCNLYKCEDVVFKYLLLVHKYFKASLPIQIVNRYKATLLAEDEDLFCLYLQGKWTKKEAITAVPLHIENLKQLHKLGDFINYMSDIIFPSKKFMIEKYNIRYQTLYLFYYPYRWYAGMRGLFMKNN